MGPNEITSELGAGRMGIVLRAHDKKLDRDVALKVPEAIADINVSVTAPAPPA